ncbi:acyltransferase family protein [Motilimonas eburnea]|uniref:acyltransferase family protein n=1 Tax=Motilimonas eburnea TaxID=1737488 RepID=UPI001E4109A5|nr:acyltransferase [Motilimonas eburnea]MCE2572807.1 acyltransferase [Motilimonas eburnea]
MLNSFNHFRAIAIIFIVAGHSFYVNGMVFDSFFSILIKNLISGGTALFVFISGFLFHYVFFKKFEYKKFIISKAKNVMLPYLVLGFLPIFILVYKGSEDFGGYFSPHGDDFFSMYIIPAIKYVFSGRFLTAYWYIPFIVVVFIMSPLHMVFIRKSLVFQLVFVFFLSLIAVFLHRPVDNIEVFQSVMYYTPVYLIGIMASIYKEKVYDFLHGKDLVLLFVVLFFASFQTFIGDIGNYHKKPFEFGGGDLMFFQKLILCFFFMVWLNKFEKYNNRYVHSVASTSFTAFFLHPFILWFVGKLSGGSLAHDSWLLFSLFVFFTLVFCIIIAKVTKKIIPSYSRYIIGY